MNRAVLALIAILCLSISEPTLADWVELGVAAKCDVTRDIFSLVPVVQTSSEEYNVLAPRGYVEFDSKANQNFKCKLHWVSINLVISVWGPSATGQGQGAGVLIIESLSVGHHAVLPHRTNFLWQVNGERVLTRIEVRHAKGGYETRFCYSDGFSWDTKRPFKKVKCGTSVEQID